MVIILINSTTMEKVAAAVEAASLGTREEKEYAASLSEPIFKDEKGQEFRQQIGEWKTYTDKEYEAIKDQLAKYPDIKEAHVLVEEELTELILERRLNQKALAMQEANKQYGEEYPLPEIASMVLKIAPVKEPEKPT
jgi:histidinol-phosphate/aromatic aminotransferase/cobyric acid decarboxylase-like protein